MSSTVSDLAAALNAVRSLDGQLGSFALSADAQYEIAMRLRVKEDQLQDALVIASALRLDATANDGLVVPGQAVGVSVAVGNRGAGSLAVNAVTLSGFDGPGGCARGVATLAAPYRAPQRSARRPTPG